MAARVNAAIPDDYQRLGSGKRRKTRCHGDRENVNLAGERAVQH